jgi:trimeric autotransporter adhesin
MIFMSLKSKTVSLTERRASSVTINSEKLAAGIYIYSVIADGKIMDSKRMVVAQK